MQSAYNSRTCDGTGMVRTVDRATLVPDDSLTIDEGAVEMCIRDRLCCGQRPDGGWLEV